MSLATLRNVSFQISLTNSVANLAVIKTSTQSFVITQCTYKKAVLSQGERRDASVNFDTYRILQRHRAGAASLPQHDFLVPFKC